MDSAHVSLVALQLNEAGFEEYRCDKAITLGINLVDFSKILKMALADDVLTLKADEDNSYLNILFENKSIQAVYFLILNLLSMPYHPLKIITL